MCSDSYSESAYRLAEKLISRGWDRTAAYGYARAWQRKKVWNDYYGKKTALKR